MFFSPVDSANYAIKMQGILSLVWKTRLAITQSPWFGTWQVFSSGNSETKCRTTTESCSRESTYWKSKTDFGRWTNFSTWSWKSTGFFETNISWVIKKPDHLDHGKPRYVLIGSIWSGHWSRCFESSERVLNWPFQLGTGHAVQISLVEHLK